MSLQCFCHKPVIKILPESSIAHACRLMEEHNVGCLIAENEGTLCGILTDRDIALKVTGADKDPQKTRVKDIMTTNPIRISVEKDIQHVISLIHAYNVRRIPIVNGFDTVLGIVTLDDLIALVGAEISEMGKAISEESPQETA